MSASSVKQSAQANDDTWLAPRTELACCQRASTQHASPNHLHLICRTKDRCYALSVYRSNPSLGFPPRSAHSSRIFPACCCP
ncbi:hypothetical protein QNM99_28050 [Pseudomonas sp. PCH446]